MTPQVSTDNHRPAYRTSSTAVALIPIQPRRSTSTSTITDLGWTPQPSVPPPITLDSPSPRKSLLQDPYRPSPIITSSSSSSRPSKKVQMSPSTLAPSSQKKSFKGKGKGRATSFVVGAPSSGSGDEGDVDTGATSSKTGDDVVQEHAEEYLLTGESFSDEDETKLKELSVEEIIRWQIRQPIQTVDSLDLDACLPLGIGDYTFVLSPTSTSSCSKSKPSTPVDSKSRATIDKPDRVSLGKGKFSEVLLVRKGNVDYALKHTPLHPHHPLIATRLLREPTILAQLIPHPNLVTVFETIRTPGHFYLVEENLAESITLESLVASQPGQVLGAEMAWSVLDQLSSVVRSLHEPLRVCHRDIKPENILIRVTPSEDPDSPPTLLLKLLDFGLATHYSSSEAKLTTCCGSPAYHSPELWRSLREPSGSVKYWGPEVDIWCLGLTLLRCLTPNKYPLGISHSSIFALSDKVVDALLAVRDEPLRRALAALLQMDGEKRMRAFEKFCIQRESLKRTEAERANEAEEGKEEEEEVIVKKKEFKSTTFIPTERTHSLDLPLSPTASAYVPLFGTTSRSPSRSRHQHHQPDLAPPQVVAELSYPRSAGPSSPDLATADRSSFDSLPRTPRTRLARKQSFTTPIEIILLNPTDEPIRRSASYIKYALRCAGILYHVRDNLFDSAFSRPSEEGEDDASFVCLLQCVIKLPATAEQLHPSKASSALIAALRPPIVRAHTTGGQVRSSSTPPGGKASTAKKEEVKALTFFLSIRKASADAEHEESFLQEIPPPLPTSNHPHHRHSQSQQFQLQPSQPPQSQRQASSSRRPGESQSRRQGESQSRKSRASKRRGGDRIIISLSDERALTGVREALKMDNFFTSPLATEAEDRRGRTGRAPVAPGQPNRLVSGSRDRRTRHHSHPLKPLPDNEVPPVGTGSEGLGLKLTPFEDIVTATTLEEKRLGNGGGGFFDFVAKIPGLGSRQSTFVESRPGSPKEREAEGETARARAVAMASVAF